MDSIFITGIGTGIGKTIVSAIVCSSIQADYWKPVQAGIEQLTDSQWVRSLIPSCKVHPEIYKLDLAASPHIAARQQGIEISLEKIKNSIPAVEGNLIIEGAGGLLVPLNSKHFVLDLVRELGSKVVLVSRNYLGSINHSLMTAEICRANEIQVSGWIFNDQFMDYEDEISYWSNIPKIASIPYSDSIDTNFVSQQADRWRDNLSTYLC